MAVLVIPQNIFTLDGNSIDPCGSSCGSVGQTIDISTIQVFPDNGCTGLERTVHIVIENTDTGLIVFDETFDDADDDFSITILDSYLITTYGKHKITYTVEDCLESTIQEILLQICFNYVITKESCHVYNISDLDSSAAGAGKINTFAITSADGSYSNTLTLDMTTGTFVQVTFPSDNIYQVVITNNLTDDVITMPIYDLCDTTACTKKLILEILCNEADPCCKDCSQETKTKLEQQRGELNKIMALGSVLLSEIRKDELQNLGIYTFDSTREANFQIIGYTFTKLSQIIDRCGQCKQSLTNATIPCSNC